MITAARQIAEAFRQTYESNQSLDEVITLMDKLVKDEEQSVRMVVMEQIPEIGLFCHQVGEPLKYVIEEEIIPHIISLLADNFTQVRKVAQTAVVTLVERGVMSKTVVEEQVFPVILKLSDLDEWDDHRPEIEVITFMCKMAPMVGKSAIVNFYLSSFCFSCEDSGFQVRRVCAMGMAEMAPLVGTVLTEKALLPRFLTLCEDEIWGVRKSCAEVFTTVAKVCSYNVRKKCLAQAFINLLEDHSRWVRLTAFQTLGQLIAIFAQDEKDDVPLEADELEQHFLNEVKKCTKIIMEKRNQELVEANTRKAAAEKAEKESASRVNGNEVKFAGSNRSLTSEEPCPERAPDPFDDDDEDDNYDWPAGRPQGEKQYSWLLDRSFAPAPDRDWGGEEDWGDIPMDCSDAADPINQTAEKSGVAEDDDWFGDGVTETIIPEELPLDAQDEDGIVSRDTENNVSVDQKGDKANGHELSVEPPFVPTSSEYRKDTSDESQLESLPSKISVSRKETSDRIHIHVGTIPCTSPLSPTPSDTSSGVSSLSSNSVEPSSHNTFNTFQFWRLPIPDLELDIDMKNGKATNVHVRAKVQDPSNRLTYSSQLNVSIRMDTGDQSEANVKQDSERSQDTETITDKSNGQAPPLSVDWDDEEWQTEDWSSFQSRTSQKPNGAKGETTIEVNGHKENSDDVWDAGENTSEVTRNASENSVGVSQDVHRSYYNLYSVSSTPNNGEKSTVIEVKYQKKIQPNEKPYFDEDYYSDRFGSEANQTENLPYIVRAHGPSGDQGRLLPTLQAVSTVQDQDVVPPALLKHYLSMAETRSEDSPMENEMPVYCAYTFPAVVTTLGGENWGILRECFEKLATMFQWKIRYTLGACLHEIARVIGPELTERDLLPFYDAITRDIDEVRSGILNHIAKFTRILRGEARYCILDTLNSFLRTDNKNNWRFRFELTQQIEELTAMYDAEDVSRHLCPMALELANDPISDVRRAAIRVLTEQVKKLNEVKDWEERPGGNLLRDFVLKLVEQFGHSVKWVQRQSFAILSGQLIMFNALEPAQFAQDILPHLINLSTDKVPNIRIAVAQALSQHIIKLDYFADPSNPHNSIIMDTMEKLQNDTDGDVRYYSTVRSNPKTLRETAAAILKSIHQDASAQ